LDLKKIIRKNAYTFSETPFTDELNRSIAPPDWTAKISFRGTGNNLDVDGDSEWNFVLSSEDTGSLAVGVAYYQVYAENGDGEIVIISTGQIEVQEFLKDAAGGYDPRTQLKKDLDAVQATIRSIISGGAVMEYHIGTRSIKKYTLEELLSLESKLKYQVIREDKSERIKNGLGNPNNLFVRFRR
jgi:hypothetical protein